MTEFKTNPFPNYQEIPKVLPSAIWWVLRVAVLLATAGIIYLIAIDPEQGGILFWAIVIPSLPLLFTVAPGIWRQVCPMALLNQLPRTLGISRGYRLPAWAKNTAFLIATTSFFIVVSLRHLIFNENALSLLILLFLALGLSLLGGFLFAGRSGWCGTFCPLAPIQKAYGHAPILLVGNGYCETCVGCQKNCYDFNPKAALLTDLADEDPWFARHKLFFVAALPGFAFAFFTADPIHETGLFAYYRYIFGWIVTSMGFFFICRSYVRLSHFRAAAFAAMLALVLFYGFTAEGIITAAAGFLSLTPPVFLDEVLIGVVASVAARVLWNGYVAEKDFAALQVGKISSQVSVGVDKAMVALAKDASKTMITDIASGRSFVGHPEKSTLESIEAAGFPIDSGCRMGACGADPVVIVSGEEHISPPSDGELATLRRLGLEGRARLACVCKTASGTVVIDLETDPYSLPEPEASKDTIDYAETTGIQKVVIVGNGVAGSTIANELRRLGLSCSIDVIASENHPFYNRMAIGRLLHETRCVEDLYFTTQEAMAKQRITLHLNTMATSIDRVQKRLHLGTGDSLSYDRLVLANGASAFAPPILGMEKPGTFLLREAADAQAIRAWCQSQNAHTAVVLGGGVLGVEAADSLRKNRLETTLVQRSSRLMDRELDEKGSRILHQFLTRIGINVITNASAEEIIGEAHVEQVRLTNGDVLDTDIFLVCAGVKPNSGLAEAAGLSVARGVLVDEKMQTSDPHILAVGDVAERIGMIGGLWTVGTSQAEVAAHSVFGLQKLMTSPTPLVSLKMAGIDVKGFGIKQMEDGVEEIVDPNEGENIHRKLFVKDGQIVGAVFVGPPGTGNDVAQAIQSGTDITPVIDRLRKFEWGALAEC